MAFAVPMLDRKRLTGQLRVRKRGSPLGCTNAIRHSYASYLLALCQAAGKLADRIIWFSAKRHQAGTLDKISAECRLS